MRWTKEEEQFLRDNYGEHGPTYCAKILNRAYKAVTVKASKLNLTKTKYWWSKQEDKFLTQNYSERGANYCAENLDRSYESVLNRAWQLSLKSKASWSEQEIHFLIDNYADKGPAYCAENLNRSYSGVFNKARSLNLQANTRYNSSNIVYVVYFSDLFLYKIGITSNVKRRIKEFGQPCVILKIQECEPKEAAELERKLLKSVTLINTGALNNGNTETFMQSSKEIEEFLGNQFA